MKEETFFDKFMQASKLDKFNVQQFSQKLNSYNSDNKELNLEYPKESLMLPKVKSRVNKIAQKRKSDRAFSEKAMTNKELSKVLSSFKSWNGLEHRGYPSAGATYVTEIFCIPFNTTEYKGNVLYYDSEKHGVTVVNNNAPNWKNASKILNMNIDGEPNILIIFVVFSDRAVLKYGERGGRFALLEAGAAMQQLSTQIAEAKSLKGVIVGGMHDDEWLNILELENTEAHIALGYLVGK